MGSLRRRLTTMQVNGQDLTVNPKETLLQAALRGGVEFPSSCRVGGCGTCKCKLAKGRVKELTETGYLLTEEELDEGYILACQSVPLTDVEIEIDLARGAARGVSGQILAQEAVTHDIVRLTVQLQEPIPYRAGQFANISMEGLPGVVRSYSFASPSHRSGEVTFYIRRVPGGKMSSLVNDEDVVGRQVLVEGGMGDFWLRPDDAPLLFVAGGSGLAPILAMLKQGVAEGTARSATLLFGAREAKDLYALEEIERIAAQWQGEFRFEPVLSDADDDDAWTGARGFVTDKLGELMPEGAHSYLCGPPAMIDSAISHLDKMGVARANIHFDRFTTQADAVAGQDSADAGVESIFAATAVEAGPLDYLKYFGFHGIGLLSISAIFGGGTVATVGLLVVVAMYLLGDALVGDDTSTPNFRYPGILTMQLWLALPLLCGIVFAGVWSISPGDPLGAGAWLTQLTGYDVIAARQGTTFGGQFSIFTLTGLMIGMIGTITAHELTHRTWDPISMWVGRWLLAFSFDTNFAIEHVYGHHRYVSTVSDPATAPRGRNVYHHIVASTIAGNISAWRIEVARLKKKHLGVFSRHNAVIRGQLMSAMILAAAYAMGGGVALGFFIICGIWGKSLLEIVNYMEHYGIVRNPETPVQPRHSWNTNSSISSWTMFNLTRHSHHHAQGEVPYQDLKSYPDAPMMVSGYLATIMIAMIPPLWHKLMTPKVLAWDREYATAEERELAALANERSGASMFTQASSASTS